MAKEMIVSVNGREKKIAIVDNGKVSEFYIERGEENSGVVGNVYKGRVMRVLPGMQSAFVDIGLERDAFLYVSDFFDEEEEIERVVQKKKGSPDEAKREADERIEQNRIEREKHMESAHEIAEPLADISVAPNADRDNDRDRGRDRNDRRDRNKRGRQREDERSETEVKPEKEEKQSLSRDLVSVVEAGTDLQIGAEDDGFERISDDEDTGDLFKDAYVQEAIVDRVRAIEFDMESTGEASVGSLLAELDQPADQFERIGDDDEPAEPVKKKRAPSKRSTAAKTADKEKAEKPAKKTPAKKTTSRAKKAKTEEPLEDAEASVKESSDTAEMAVRRGGRGRRKTTRPKGKTKSAALADEVEDSELDDIELSEAPDAIDGDDETNEVAEPVAEVETTETEDSAELVEEVVEKPKRGRGRKSKAAEKKAEDAIAEDAPAEVSAESTDDAKAEDTTDSVEAVESDAAASEEVKSEGDERQDRPEREGRGRNRRGRGGRNRGDRPENGERSDTGERTERTESNDRNEKPERNGRGDRPERNERNDRGRGGRNDRGRDRGPQPAISDLLREGTEILVQIAKEPIAKKGARITSHIAMPGRYLVYMPTIEHLGVSRKIESSSERGRLRTLIQRIRQEPEITSGGFIVRTAGIGISEEDLKNDALFLFRSWKDAKKGSEKKRSPSLIHQDLDLVQRLLRDQLSDDFAAIRVDSEEEYQRTVEFMNLIAPRMVHRVKLYTRDEPILEYYGVQEEIDKALKPRVWLKSGGYLVINQTEALVAIDVNTGKFVGKGNVRLEDTITKTNMEAVDEIARQIRLRDLGGIIVLDLIDMEDKRNRHKVADALREALSHDKSPNKVLSFNDFGLIIMTRKRVKQSLERTMCAPCDYCEGAGWIKSPTTVCYEILAEARRLSKQVDDVRSTTLRVHPDVVAAFRSTEREVLEEIEAYLGNVDLASDKSIHQAQYDFAFI